jgi:CBS domain-containing protein
MGQTVETVMHRTPATITADETLSAAQALMEREGVRQLPVLEKGALAGILSERDLHAHTGYLERTKVNVAMTRELVTVTPTTSALQAARLLIDRKFNALPVVDGDRLVGIVSRTDLLRLLVGLLEKE